MKISLVIVTHFSSDVLPGCLAGFRREAAVEGHELQIIVVEHSETAAESAAVSSLGVDRVLERPNRGYAAGLNAGAAEAEGEVVFLANPDIVLLEGGLRPLLDALHEGFNVVGPKLYWDSQAGLLLPPPEDSSGRGELRRVLRRRWPRYWRRTLDAELESLHTHWSSPNALEVENLRGPLLGLTRSDWHRFGEMDEGYFLFFEETEWLLCARRSGARLAIAGDSKLVHRWGHSTGRREDVGAIEDASRQRFMERNYGRVRRSVIGVMEGTTERPFIPLEISDIAALPEVDADLWLFSPFEHLSPAVGWVGGEGHRELAAPFLIGGTWYAMAAVRGGNGWQVEGLWSWKGSANG